MIILGIDPGLAEVGYGVIEQNGRGRQVAHLEHGVIRTAAGDPTAQRLQRIYRELKEVIRRRQPDAVAVEELFFAANVKTAIGVAQARGAAILATAETATPMAEYSPPQIKMALVGYGRAGKRQVQMMVQALLGLDEMPRPDHAADALAAALCHLHTSQSFQTKGKRSLSAQIKSSEDQSASEQSPNKILLAQQRTRKRRRR